SSRGHVSTFAGSPVNAASIQRTASTRLRRYSPARLRRVASCKSRCTEKDEFPGRRVTSERLESSLIPSDKSLSSAPGIGTSSRNSGIGSGENQASLCSKAWASSLKQLTEI